MSGVILAARAWPLRESGQSILCGVKLSPLATTEACPVPDHHSSTIDPCDDSCGAGERAVSGGWWLGVLVASAIVVWSEVERWQSLITDEQALWLFDMNVDSTPFAVLLLVLPVCWFVRQPILSHVPRGLVRCEQWLAESPHSGGHRWRAIVLALAVGLLAFWNCQRLAATPMGAQSVEFGHLPPAFHDEFSYLFQAAVFRTGAWSVPSHPDAARLFDQMHVLNEGRFASRYFPGTGFWIVALSGLGAEPLTAYWIATALTAAMVFAIGRELSNNGVGVLAGVLVAFSPGMGLFGNLILGHQPTLVGLGLFLWAFLRLQRSSSSTPLGVVLLSGIGLSFAMLCRPMTAAGVGLPLGVWLALRLGQQLRGKQFAEVGRLVLGFALPLAIGFGMLISQNLAITGRVLKTPYALYTELFTPRHMYGFHNVERAKPLLTDRVLAHYDQWAENLTFELAVKNVGMRWLASWVWTLGLVALTVSLSVFIAAHVGRCWRAHRTGMNDPQAVRWLLILATILSLHAAHVPYWYDGILHWHYVFESGPLWCLVAAEAAALLVSWFRRTQRHWMAVWWGLVLMVSVLVNQLAVPPFWSMSRVRAGLNELAFAKLKHADFRAAIAQAVSEHPALVLVKHDPSDRHIDYVLNSPMLDDPVLIGRWPATGMSEVETIKLADRTFPERAIYLLDISRHSISRLRPRRR